METPETRYTKSGDVHIAYQVLGGGRLDLVFLAEFWNSIEAMWEQPDFARFLERLGSFARVICLDQRGTGSSDPVSLSELPTLEVWADDVIAVMDAAGSSKAAVLGSGGGGGVGMSFAATFPERVHALVLLNTTARYTQAPDYPWGTSPEFEARIEKELEFGWGRGVLLETVGPNRAGDAAFRNWWARYQRLGSSPGTVLAMRHMLQQLDVRHVLSSIRVPTLVIHRRDNRLVPVTHGRFLAEHIPSARYAEVDGDDYFPFIGNADLILDEIEEFLTGERRPLEHDRVLATVLFTDIAGSTELAARLGDLRWRELIDRHHAAVRAELERHRGREVDTAGDGFLATFDGPARAIRCAVAIREALRPLDIEIRAGLHTGELELAGSDVRGIAVHIGSRVAGEAGPGEVVVSSTVRDLAAGSGIRFEDRGPHPLKGVPDEWRLYTVVSA
ncbi:MAG: adenylate/guanylate cyclase domain-containing protein [Actinobacteria bacterium]|nr:adenylate/guanylate cyclase domain-containing protein [Actinomycetota bacterium]